MKRAWDLSVYLLIFCLIFSSLSTNNYADAKSPEKTELIVFAAASMNETLSALKRNYEEAHPEIKIYCNFDSSGTLKTQIQEDAACDIFLSAGQKQMDQLDLLSAEQDNPERLDYILEGSRIDLLENQIVLVVPEGNPAGITSFHSLIHLLDEGSILFAMGNADVPVGLYTSRLLSYYDLKEDELAAKGSITYGTNAKEVTIQVREGAVDCGIVYRTDAISAGLEIVDWATEEMCGKIVYPVGILKSSTSPEAAQEFLNYLTSDEAMNIFSAVGFIPATLETAN